MPTGGPPEVYGEREGDSPRTLLIYAHYDVQPPEPMELWTTPPFQLTIRDGHAYARGVSDDKGHFVARLNAVKAILKVKGRLPCRIKFILEGEEEVGSPHLASFVEQNKPLLRADACIWEGGGVDYEGRPLIVLGLKGIAYVELEATGPNRDVHSSYGTVVPNPAWRLVSALSTIRSRSGRVRIKGFYDPVRRPTREEMQALRAMPDESEGLRRSLGLKGFVGGVKGTRFHRRHLLEPACSICGMVSGYTGPGTKTIVPSVARAKIDFRLVPDQDPAEVTQQLKEHLREHGFDDIWVIEFGDFSRPARTPLTSPWVKVLEETAREVYGKPPVVSPSMAGSGPMYLFTDVLKMPVAMSAGISYPDNRIHSPNENIRVDDFLKGILHAAAVIERFAQS
jgi:acetylornithine deacetylase/succinyl-diaminopimelate desuccinylase-like protein